jgi:hypothetical protein
LKKVKEKFSGEAAKEYQGEDGEATIVSTSTDVDASVEHAADAEEEGGTETRQFFSTLNIALLAEKYNDEDITKLIDIDMQDNFSLDRMLMPGKSNYVAKATLQSLHDLHKFKNIEWSHVVYEPLKEVCDGYASDCCMVVFMVSTSSYFNNPLSFWARLGMKVTNCRNIGSHVILMDCVKRNDSVKEQAGRINLYNDDLVKQLLCGQSIQQVDGMKRRIML